MAKGRPVSAAKHAARLRIKALRRQQPPDSSVENYVAASQPGCHVVHKNAQWIVGVQKHRSSRCPDIVIDPESGLLSVYNRDDYVKSFTISFSYPFLDAVCIRSLYPLLHFIPRSDLNPLDLARLMQKGHNLEHGTTRTDTGEEKECITLVLVVNGHTLMDVGYLVLPPNMDLADVCIDSDIKAVTLHSDPDTIGMSVLVMVSLCVPCDVSQDMRHVRFALALVHMSLVIRRRLSALCVEVGSVPRSLSTAIRPGNVVVAT